MAGVIVDVLVERLVTFALDKIQREINLASGVKQEITNLTKKLQAIQAVMEDAEQRQVMEASVKLWLNELNDVAFKMDDVVDEWITKVCMHQLESEGVQNCALVDMIMKVCSHCPFPCIQFGQVDYHLFLRRKIANEIEELNGRLASIDLNKQWFTLVNIPRGVPDLSEGPKTSQPNVKTFGRDSEKELIISKLLSEGSEGNVVPLIIPIVGLGGMGKTSLANLVYNDDQIKSHFDKSMWVCVSDPFKEIKIARAIVEALDKENSSIKSDELETLLKEISRLIKGKKFLLVLDDVWSPKWEELSKPLCEGAIGSRVLVTTRNEKVANVMKATTQMIRLKELNESFCLSLFYYNAGIDESSVCGEYSKIGLELVRKCKGLPLAAKSLGSLMSTKKTIHEWRAVLNSKIWGLKGIQEDVFRPLMLSYQNLDLAVKRCLLYCVLFPKDDMYDKTTLIELWMSQDYLNAHGSENSLTTGQNYFDELAKLSFFQDLEVDNVYDGAFFKQQKIRCKIHDIVHDFLQYLTKNEYLILGDGETEVQSGEARHLGIAYRHDVKSVVSILSNCKKLRSFSLIVNDEDNSSIGPILELIQGVRTLSLFLYKRKRIPETMSRLIHLRYLDLSNNHYLDELPRDVMGGLYNLQTLRLVECEKLQKVYVGGLVNLKHLYVEGCEPFLEGVEKLTRLQTLDWFEVSDDGNKLEHLRDLNQLQGSLEIRISKVENNTTKIMVNKAHLLDLNLVFGWIYVTSEEPVATYEDTMESLEPHPNLERLYLYGYKGNRFSNWLSSLHSLTSLSLGGCEISEISPLGKLKSLERLEMSWLKGLERMGVEFLGIEETSLSSNFISFPKLTHLRMNYMRRLQIWEGVKEEDNYNKITIMPCLTHLEIVECNELEALPDFLWETPLQKLEIFSCPALNKLYGEEDGEQRSKISHIPEINIY